MSHDTPDALVLLSHLHRFAECFTGDIEDITTKQIEDWLRSLEVSGRTRNNVRNSVVLLSYQAPGSLGRKLLERGPTVQFRG